MSDNNIRKIEITRVIDGDTFEGTLYLIDIKRMSFKDGTAKFRVAVADTPERGKPGYDEATEYTRSLIDGKTLNGRIHLKDAFGRYVTTLFLEDGTQLEEHLLQDGYAEIWK